MVATHIFHELVFSTRLYMMMGSWGFCVLVFDSSGKTAAQTGDAFAVVPDGSKSEFGVGRAISCDEVPSLGQSPPMGCASSM